MKRFAGLIFISIFACSIPKIPPQRDIPAQPPPGGGPIIPDIQSPTGDSTQIPDISAIDQGKIEACTPNCYNKSCGSDGCGGSCGTCPSGTKCADDGSMCIPDEVLKPPGGECLPDEFCGPYIQYSYNGNVYRNPKWPDCLNKQCKDGPCTFFRCSKWCNHPIDLDNSKVKQSKDCPEGYVCIPWDEDHGACVLSASFKKCTSDRDCPSSEICGLIKHKKTFEMRCIKPWKGVSPGHPCNIDPALGPIKECETGLCIDGLCSKGCNQNMDCFDGVRCNQGKCPDGRSCKQDEDCARMTCEGVTLFNMTSVTACVRKKCTTDDACPSDSYCKYGQWNTYVGGECEVKLFGGQKYGEKCDKKHPCKEDANCINGYCTHTCEKDEDCDSHFCRKVARYLHGYDRSANPQLAIVGYCEVRGGSHKNCYSDKECPDSEVCELTLIQREKDNTTTYTSGGRCVMPDIEQQITGQTCDLTQEYPDCASGICMSMPWDHKKGWCSSLCRTLNDCQSYIVIDNQEFKQICDTTGIVSLSNISNASSIPATVCVPVNKDSSLKECSPEKKCDSGEFCRPIVLDQKLKGICVKPDTYQSVIGSPCDPQLNGLDCVTNLCVSWTTPYSGLCTKWCKSDKDCQTLGPDFSCVHSKFKPYLPEIALGVCRHKGECSTCLNDYDCPTSQVCIDLNSGSWPRDYRCVTSCKDDSDCPEGRKCMVLNGPDANMITRQKHACSPITCP